MARRARAPIGWRATHDTGSPSPPAAVPAPARSRAAATATGSSRWSSHEEEQRQKREEAVRQIHGNASLLNEADNARESLRAAHDRHVHPVPEMVFGLDRVA